MSEKGIKRPALKRQGSVAVAAVVEEEPTSVRRRKRPCAACEKSDVPVKRSSRFGNPRKLQRDEAGVINEFISLIAKELVTGFGKTSIQAKRLLDKAEVFDTLTKNPIGLHDSPHEWALKVLTKNNQFRILKKYYSS